MVIPDYPPGELTVPVVVNCGCGKTLRIPDQYAGKKVKCPACAGVLAVPAASAKAQAKATETAAPQRSSRRDDESAGTKMRREPTQQPQRRITREDRLASYEPDTRKTAPDEREAEPVASKQEITPPADEEKEDKPTKKRKKKGAKKKKKSVLLPLVLAGCALLLIAGGGVGAWRYFSRGVAGSDFDYVPSGWAQAFVLIRVADLSNSPTGQSLMSQFPKSNGDFFTEVEKNLGVPLNDIERVTLVFQNVQSIGWILVTTVKSVDKSKVKASLSLQDSERAYMRKSYFAGPKQQSPC